jgi:hypothetical protein
MDSYSIKSNTQQDPDKKPKTRLSGGDIFYCIIALGFFLLAGFFSGARYTPVEEADLMQISGKITNPVRIYTDSKHRESITLTLDAWPKLDYLLSEDRYRASRPKRFVKNVKMGDSISIGVKKKDFEIAKNLVPPIKPGDDRLIIYGLRDKTTTYLDLAKYNEIASEEMMYTSKVFPWILVLVGLFFCRSLLILGWKSIMRRNG